MRLSRVWAMTRRVATQIRRDHRSVGLLLVVPMIVMGLLGYILRLDPGPLRASVVNEDAGTTLPNGAVFSVAELLTSELDELDDIVVVESNRAEAEAALRARELDVVLLVPEGLSEALLAGEPGQLELMVEGSNPGQSEAFSNQFSAMLGRAISNRGATGQEPDISIETRYLYAGPEFEFLDSFAPSYIAFFAFFFVFMLTGVSFLRERTQGTMERLLATPVTRLEIVVGYMMGFGIFALVQSAVILFFTIWVLQIRYVGSLGLVFVLLGLLAVGAVNLGIFLSTYARTELQVIQFIPIVIVPQALLSGFLLPVENFPKLLQWASQAMPLTYANRAMTDVMIRGLGFSQVAGDLAVLAAFAILALVLSAATLRRQFI